MMCTILLLNLMGVASEKTYATRPGNHHKAVNFETYCQIENIIAINLNFHSQRELQARLDKETGTEL